MNDFSLLVDQPEINEEAIVEVAANVLELELEVAEANMEASELRLVSAESMMEKLESQVTTIKTVQASLEAFGNTEVLQGLFANKELDALMPGDKTFAETEAEVAVEAIMDTVKAAGAKVWEFIKKIIVSIIDMIKKAFGVLETVKKIVIKKQQTLLKSWDDSIDISLEKVENIPTPGNINGVKSKVLELLTNMHMMLDKNSTMSSDPGQWIAEFQGVLGVGFDPTTFKVYTDTKLDVNKLMRQSGDFGKLDINKSSIADMKFEAPIKEVKAFNEKTLKVMKALQGLIPKKDVSELDIKLFEQVCPKVILEAAAASMGLAYGAGKEEDAEIYYKVAADAVVKMNNLISSVTAIASKRMVDNVLRPSLELFTKVQKAVDAKKKEAAAAAKSSPKGAPVPA